MINPLMILPLDLSCNRECAAVTDSKDAMVVTLPWVLRLERLPFDTDKDLPSALSNVKLLHLDDGSLGSLKRIAMVQVLLVTAL